MHIAVFYQYFHSPDCPAAARHYTFVREWSKSHRVTVITGNSWYGRRLSEKFAWGPPGVDVRMLDVPYDNAMSSRQRLGAFARYAAGAIRTGLKIDRPDVIFATSTPLSAVWAAARVARLKRVRWIFEVRDLWPEFPIQMGAIENPFLERYLRHLERNLYRDATHVIALSPDMAKHVTDSGTPASKVTTVVNGTDFDLLDSVSEQEVMNLRQRHSLSGRKIVLYAGMFGRANAIPLLLDTARRLVHRADIAFVFVGDGFLAPEIRKAAQEFDNIVAPGPSARHAIFKWFMLADVTLVSFIDLPVLASNSPSKFFDSLGAGTPVIVTNPGWTKQFVEKHACGWYVPPGDARALSTKIAEILDSPWDLARAGVNGRRIAVQEFDRTRMASQIEQILISS